MKVVSYAKIVKLKKPFWEAKCGDDLQLEEGSMPQQGCGTKVIYTNEDLFQLAPPVLCWRCPVCGTVQIAPKQNRLINCLYPSRQEWLAKKEKWLENQIFDLQNKEDTKQILKSFGVVSFKAIDE